MKKQKKKQNTKKRKKVSIENMDNYTLHITYLTNHTFDILLNKNINCIFHKNSRRNRQNGRSAN